MIDDNKRKFIKKLDEIINTRVKKTFYSQILKENIKLASYDIRNEEVQIRYWDNSWELKNYPSFDVSKIEVFLKSLTENKDEEAGFEYYKKRINRFFVKLPINTVSLWKQKNRSGKGEFVFLMFSKDMCEEVGISHGMGVDIGRDSKDNIYIFPNDKSEIRIVYHKSHNKFELRLTEIKHWFIAKHYEIEKYTKTKTYKKKDGQQYQIEINGYKLTPQKGIIDTYGGEKKEGQ